MAFVAAICTQCGGTLKIDDSKDAGICPFCGTAFVTEKVIQNYNIKVSNHIDTVVVQNSEKNDLIERCKGFLEVENYDILWRIAYDAIDKYPNELFFYTCCLLSTIKGKGAPNEIYYEAYERFKSLLQTASKFRHRATDWEESIMKEAEKYITNSSLRISYSGLIQYYIRKLHVDYETAKKRKLKKDISSVLKGMIGSKLSILLFWLPFIYICVGFRYILPLFSIDLGELSAPAWIAIIIFILCIIYLGYKVYYCYNDIRESMKEDPPVTETLYDYLNNRVIY